MIKKILSLVLLCAAPLAAQIQVTGTTTLTGTASLTVTPFPVGNASPGSLAYGSVVQSTTSASQAVTLQNTGVTPITIINILLSAQYTMSSTCGATLAGSASCVVNVTFAPTGLGSIPGTLTINDNTTTTPHTVTLSGTGISASPAIATLNPTSIAFGNQQQGSSSASQPVTLQNTGGASLTISSIVASSQYSQSNNCPGSLVASATCTINVVFSPTSVGSVPGTVSVTDSASGSPHTVTLSGTGTAVVGLPATTGWFQMPSTSVNSICPSYTDIHSLATSCVDGFLAWSGGLMDTNRNRLIMHIGGHNDYWGNELYAIDLNGTPIAPVLAKDASHGSQISNLGSTPETLTDGSPDPRHTYSGMIYLPTQDNYFLYGAFKSVNGNSSDTVWLFNPRTAVTSGGTGWTSVLPATHPQQATFGSIPLTAYDRVTDTIYEIEDNIPNFWKYTPGPVSGFPVTNTWTLLNGSSAACPSTTFASAGIDPVNRLYFCVGDGMFWKVSLNSPFTETNITSASGCGTLVAANGPGFDYDPIQKVMVGWVSGNNVIQYNALTNTCSTVSTFSGGPTTFNSNGTFGKFKYSPSTGGFVQYSDPTHNAFHLRLTTPPTAAATDFTNRCGAAGVIVCDSFDSLGVTPQRTCADNNSGMYKDCFDGSSVYMTIDTTTFRSGGGSMEATIPGTAASDPTGYYRRLFQSTQSSGPGTATVFGQNSDFYVQFAQRMDSPFITNSWPASGGGLTYWKQQIISTDTATCSNEELTTVNVNNAGYPLMYSRCGADPFQISSGLSASGLFNEFNAGLINSGTFNGSTMTLTGGNLNGPTYNCPYNSTQPNANCFDYSTVVNTWVTYYYHVHVGTWGGANSLIEAWVSTPTSPAYRQWLYLPNHILLQDGSAPGYDMVTLLAYWTNRSNGSSAGPTSHTWYDELIVSSQPIAPPLAPPAAP